MFGKSLWFVMKERCVVRDIKTEILEEYGRDDAVQPPADSSTRGTNEMAEVLKKCASECTESNWRTFAVSVNRLSIAHRDIALQTGETHLLDVAYAEAEVALAINALHHHEAGVVRNLRALDRIIREQG